MSNHVQTFMPKINGKSFRCECGCNVFTKRKPLATGEDVYRCNACPAQYAGTPLPPVEVAP
jgi:predicted SprT family Zn-dependent metalloprotease